MIGDEFQEAAQRWHEQSQKLLDRIEDILSDLESLDSTHVRYDRNWDCVRESGRGGKDDLQYVRMEDIQEIIHRHRRRDGNEDSPQDS